jgi:CHAD domain-containing protein
MQEKIREYYLIHKLVFEEMFSKSLNDFDKEAIHKMRTSTKRLRALFQLIESISKKKFSAKKQLKSIRHLFKLAGRIRELQIEGELLADYESEKKISITAYHEYLSGREHQEIAHFLKALPPLTERKNILNDEIVLNAIKSIKPKKLAAKVEAFLKGKFAAIKRINSNKISNHKVHQNRTIIKQLYYLYGILIIESKGENVMGMAEERLREIEQLIGEWHDRVNSIYYINAFRKTRAGKNTQSIEHYKKFMKSEKDRRRSEIVKILEAERLK